MADELRRRLQEVLDARYRGSARKFSLAAGLNPNAVGNILRNPRHRPELESLQALGKHCGWPLDVVVRWPLDLPETPAEDPLDVDLDRVLRRYGLDQTVRGHIRGLIEALSRPSDDQLDGDAARPSRPKP
jgi:hypothetical protein